ncbi:MAG: single-stranded DNA-binding protein, partial [Bacteroidales bacterium]
VLWRQLAELAEKYIRKGTQVFIEGKIRTRSWEDKEGQKRYTTEIVADNLRLLGRRDDAASGQGFSPSSASSNTQSTTSIEPIGSDNNDLPF